MNRKKKLQIKRLQKRKIRRLLQWARIDRTWRRDLRKQYGPPPKFRRVNCWKAYKLNERRRIGDINKKRKG